MAEAEVSQAVVLFVTLFAMMVGMIFTLIPPIPGTLVIWGASLGYGLVLGWEKLGWLAFSLITILMIAGIAADFLGGQFGAKLGGASCLAVVVGTVVGLILGFIISLVGTPLLGCLAGMGGTLGGILLIERVRYNDWRSALNATKGYLAGNIVGIMAKVTAGAIMIGVFLARVYWGG
ncbi:MAG: DUF456 domain-containing protein [Anaerolineaceae bacterium]|nr:DUF456 domain-containing protein [Anaerolineaceae bacterium]MCB9098671.1 DUF456 domain-containing protein [Anaerolineales bacterium]